MHLDAAAMLVVCDAGSAMLSAAATLKSALRAAGLPGCCCHAGLVCLDAAAMLVVSDAVCAMLSAAATLSSAKKAAKLREQHQAEQQQVQLWGSAGAHGIGFPRGGLSWNAGLGPGLAGMARVMGGGDVPQEAHAQCKRIGTCCACVSCVGMIDCLDLHAES
eukprot:scaffold280784_cov16-Tisochrysis_lutea.AAC.1